MKRDASLGGALIDPPKSQTHRVGTLVFLMAGVMLFAGLVGAYLVLRFAGGAWPAPGMPRLPVRLAGFNTAVILASSLVLQRGLRAMRTLDARGLRRGLFLAAALGSAFLLLQAVQWRLLLAGGLSFAGTTYGSTFYVLSGVHAAHALSGVVWLLLIAWRQGKPWVSDRMQRAIEVCSLYWHFVGLVWAALFVVLYLL